MITSILNRYSLSTFIRKKSRVRDFDVTVSVTYWLRLSIVYAVANVPATNTVNLIVEFAVFVLNLIDAVVELTLST